MPARHFVVERLRHRRRRGLRRPHAVEHVRDDAGHEEAAVHAPQSSVEGEGRKDERYPHEDGPVDPDDLRLHRDGPDERGEAQNEGNVADVRPDDVAKGEVPGAGESRFQPHHEFRQARADRDDREANDQRGEPHPPGQRRRPVDERLRRSGENHKAADDLRERNEHASSPIRAHKENPPAALRRGSLRVHRRENARRRRALGPQASERAR